MKIIISDFASAGWRFDNSYARLPGSLFTRVQPTPVREPRLTIVNNALAQTMGLNAAALNQPASAGFFAGNMLPDGADPIAQAYAGHQFGHFTILGDGRALVLGEHLTPDGRRLDVQFKGSGPTPYSRGGDGRAALGPMLREYLISEAMFALGIPTTRSLAVVATGETVAREEPLPGAILTRIAASHIRVGTFEYAAARQDGATLRILADYTRRRHFPELSDSAKPHHALLAAVVERQAALIAKWLLVGFIHGVMNTDNMALSGETIDYGPCAFMDAYDPATVFSSIDRRGRYAYGNQAQIAGWNLSRFAETLLPLLHADETTAAAQAREILDPFPVIFQRHWHMGMKAKIGLCTDEDGDADLLQSLLAWMKQQGADFTNTFCALSQETSLTASPFTDSAFRAWHERWTARLSRQPERPPEVLALMRRSNPAVIPRNHQVEAALAAATRTGDLAPFHRLLNVLAKPYDYNHVPAEYQQTPTPGQRVRQTFCGT